MRNDDYEAVEDLERGLRAAEREIAELERENKALKSSNANLITELQNLQCPTFMGEPVINTDLEDARRYRWLRNMDFSGPLNQVLLVYQGPTSDYSLRPDELDAAIDAQMKTKRGIPR